jgi:hypothetical protein
MGEQRPADPFAAGHVPQQHAGAVLGAGGQQRAVRAVAEGPDEVLVAGERLAAPLPGPGVPEQDPAVRGAGRDGLAVGAEGQLAEVLLPARHLQRGSNHPPGGDVDQHHGAPLLRHRGDGAAVGAELRVLTAHFVDVDRLADRRARRHRPQPQGPVLIPGRQQQLPVGAEPRRRGHAAVAPPLADRRAPGGVPQLDLPVFAGGDQQECVRAPPPRVHDRPHSVPRSTSLATRPVCSSSRSERLTRLASVSSSGRSRLRRRGASTKH